MQTTPNYSFKLPEGTDIVNPLVDMNPNWSSLDTKLKLTDDKTVFGPSCTKSGTVFAVSALLLTVCIFRITAPGRWNAGDSMTVGGSAVSVKMTDGTTPADGVFDTGSQVICIKYGGQVTIVGTNKSTPTASEVTTTGGDSVQDYIDNTKFKNLETWTPNIGENWETFLARIRDNSTKTIPANFIRCTVDGVSGLIFRQSRRTSATSWQYETDYFTGNSLIKYAMSVGSDYAVLRKYDILNGTVQNLSSADAQTINIYGLDV